MKTKCSRILFAVLLLLLFQSIPTAAQFAPLSHDIVFTEFDFSKYDNMTNPTLPHGYLAWVDANTLAIRTFYVNPDAAVFPLNWSPSGRYLAVMLSYETFGHVCILTRAAQLKVCTREKVPTNLYLRTPFLYTAIWADDEQTIAYFSTDETDSNHYRFVRASTVDGSTQELLYTGYSTREINFSANRSLTRIIEGAGEMNFIRVGGTIEFIELSRNKRLSSTISVIQSPTTPKRPLTLCTFSPDSTYIPAIPSGTDDLEIFTIFNEDGSVFRTIAKSQLEALPRTCPAWSLDEKSFYYQTFEFMYSDLNRTWIYRYDMDKGDTTPFYSGFEIIVTSPRMDVSPSGSELLGNVRYFIPGKEYLTVRQLIIFRPGNIITRLNRPLADSASPIWVPPLKQ